MNNNGSYPGGMPPYQQPYVPYQQSHQQQGYQHPQPHPGPPSPRSPQPGRIINADGRPQQQALPTRVHGPYMSGGLSTEPSPGHQYHPRGNYLAPPQPQIYRQNVSSSLASQAGHSSRNSGSSYLNPNVNTNPKPKPHAVSPVAAPLNAPKPPAPQRDPYSPNYGSQVGPKPKSPAKSHRSHDRPRSPSRSPSHRSISSSQLKSILKQPSPQPSPQRQPQPQPQPQAESKPERKHKSKSKHHHSSRHHSTHSSHRQPMPVDNPHNPLGPSLVTEQDILTRGHAELAPLTPAIRSVVAYEFALPATAPIEISFSLSPIDLDPPPPRGYPVSWNLGSAGPLHTLTHTRILAPVLTISLPAQYPHPTTPLTTFAAPAPDHGVIAACERAVASLRYGSAAPYPTSHLSLRNAYHAQSTLSSPPPPPPPGTLPFRVGGELFGSACVFRCGAADRNTVLGALDWVYLPCAGRPGFYERVEKDGREGKRAVRRWARGWGVEGELGEYFGRDG
ncbi:uncharacterized protein F4807DRAFT_436388 [Annulohypoxylon truncatum]|uniref:uncharacterized protein n=1 Tax=Annulohypoxylon truncatum TaxID=327061 RepID=UPI0020072CF7|nr:uncharacterized protein F4807DRAFT_436388 [Annulohypoxylon truncatum]KAI1207262.1 hypothetical protein F4807DRAFT_436388 [Annulohypoxylon truncatum]